MGPWVAGLGGWVHRVAVDFGHDMEARRQLCADYWVLDTLFQCYLTSSNQLVQAGEDLPLVVPSTGSIHHENGHCRPWRCPLKITQNFSKTAFRAQNFPRLRRALRGFASGSVPVSPESATLAVTIIPVTPQDVRRSRHPGASVFRRRRVLW